MKKIIEGINKARSIHIQQEAEERIKRALIGKVVEHKIDLAKAGDKVYYKREGEKE